MRTIYQFFVDKGDFYRSSHLAGVNVDPHFIIAEVGPGSVYVLQQTPESAKLNVQYADGDPRPIQVKVSVEWFNNCAMITAEADRLHTLAFDSARAFIRKLIQNADDKITNEVKYTYMDVRAKYIGLVRDIPGVASSGALSDKINVTRIALAAALTAGIEDEKDYEFITSLRLGVSPETFVLLKVPRGVEKIILALRK